MTHLLAVGGGDAGIAAALHARLSVDDLNGLDLSCTPPLGSPWDAVQLAAQGWERAAAANSAVIA